MLAFLSHHFRSYTAVSCLFALLIVSAPSTAESEAEYQQRLKTLASSIEQLKAELNDAKSSKNSLQKSLQRSEEEIGGLSKKVNNIKEALAREKKRLAQLQSNRAKLEQQRQKQQEHIQLAVRQAYQLGQESKAKLLLNQEDPELVSRLMRYHDYIVSAHQQKIDQYLKTISELNTVEKDILASQDQLKQQQRQLKERKQALSTSQKKRITALKQVNRSLKKKGQRLSSLSKDRQRLQTLLDEVANTLANIQLPHDASPFSSQKGKLPMPTKGKIIHRYGSPQFDGKLKRNGIVISNKSGAAVVSVHHGRVIFSDYLRGHGLLLIIDHGDGYMSLYGYNQTLLKEIGDWISSGEKIATIGNSGGQQQHALYFEIRYKGKPQNPQRWLKRGSQ